MISAFTLIFMVSASAQNSMRRYDQRFMSQQQRRDLYEQQRRRELMLEGRDNSVSAICASGHGSIPRWCGALPCCKARKSKTP
jgi:hypothetical protein